MKNDQIHSPYVVVLGGNKVRRKSTPPPDAHEETHKVYGVLPAVKTMATEIAEVKKATPAAEPTQSKKHWWSRKPKAEPMERVQEPVFTPTKRESTTFTTIEQPMIPQATAPIAAVPESPYRSHFNRGLEKVNIFKMPMTLKIPKNAKIGAALAVLAIVVGVPVASRYAVRSLPPTASTIVKAGAESLVAQVGKSIELPVGETPLVVVATADDIRRLNVPDAKPGNKILLYQKAGKIVVYDAEGDKVLGVVNRSQP